MLTACAQERRTEYILFPVPCDVKGNTTAARQACRAFPLSIYQGRAGSSLSIPGLLKTSISITAAVIPKLASI